MGKTIVEGKKELWKRTVRKIRERVVLVPNCFGLTCEEIGR